ncbi:sugar ABC transporter substrate-binding protein [Blautia sp. HCP28S3_G10]|uniref:sugar ABC transporter substrate-binding protein n=1 Tax=Blautia sp. HCP28S3_G10 TaxID=3438908 RepID=UPI003F8BC9B3
MKLRRLVAIGMTVALSATMFSGVSVYADNSDPEPFKIGFPWDTANTDPTWISIYNNVKAAVESAGGELVNVVTDNSADGLIDNISELISRDVDGILFMPASDSMLPAVDAMCADAGVYWGTMFRTISDDDIREAMYDSEWYAGGCNEDDETCSSNIVKSMADMGVTDLGVINIAKGDTSSDLRDKGAAEGAEEAGVNILNTTYDISVTTDMTKTIESYIAAYPEMNGILVLGTYCGGAIPTIEKALADHDKAGDIKVGRIDFETTLGDYLKEGTFNVSYGGQQQIDPLVSAVILVNKVIGTPIVEDGPTNIITPYLELTTAEEADQFNEYFLGDDAVYTADEIKDKMIKFYNPDIDMDYMNDLISTFSIADVVERHSK